MALLDSATESRGWYQDGLRGWLDQVRQMGELLDVKGAHWDAEMGSLTQMLTENSHNSAPAILFDNIPGYQKGYRTLYGHFSSVKRVALTLGLPLEGAGLLLAIDPILDMGRTAVNVAGQVLVGVIVAKPALERSNLIEATTVRLVVATATIAARQLRAEVGRMLERFPALLRAMAVFKQTSLHVALVVDEFGSVQGVITPIDLLEMIAGDFPEDHDEGERRILRREDGSWLVDARLDIQELNDALGENFEAEGGYHTVAGLILDRLGR